VITSATTSVPLVTVDWTHNGVRDSSRILYADVTATPMHLGVDLSSSLQKAQALSVQLASEGSQVGVALAVVQASDGYTAVPLSVHRFPSTSSTGRVVGAGLEGWAWANASLTTGVVAMVGPNGIVA